MTTFRWSETDMVHLLTTEEGGVRLITLTKKRGRDGAMRGAVLTQHSPKGHFHQPTVSPLVLVKIADGERATHEAMVGPIAPSAADYARIWAELELAETEVVHLATLPASAKIRPTKAGSGQGGRNGALPERGREIGGISHAVPADGARSESRGARRLGHPEPPTVSRSPDANPR